MTSNLFNKNSKNKIFMSQNKKNDAIKLFASDELL